MGNVALHQFSDIFLFIDDFNDFSIFFSESIIRIKISEELFLF